MVLLADGDGDGEVKWSEVKSTSEWRLEVRNIWLSRELGPFLSTDWRLSPPSPQPNTDQMDQIGIYQSGEKNLEPISIKWAFQ